MRTGLPTKNDFIVHQDIRGVSDAMCRNQVRVILNKQHLAQNAHIPEFMLQTLEMAATLGRNNLHVHKSTSIFLNTTEFNLLASLFSQ